MEQIAVRQSFLPITAFKVTKLVMDMKPKTNELDLLPVTFIKENIEKFVGLLVNIVNISLQSGVCQGIEDSTFISLDQESWSRCYKVQFLTSLKFVIYLTVSRKGCHESTGSTCGLS